MTVAVLFARADSVYKSLPGVDVYDEVRDARTFSGGCSVVAHPPCRAWGRLRGMGKPSDGERDLALWAVDRVRECGGVLEHPAGSLLWREARLPPPGQRDAFGGLTVGVPQFWFGHRAMKSTLLYLVGVEPCELPAIPLVLGDAPCVVDGRGRPWVTKREREATPVAFARWLVSVARLTGASRFGSCSASTTATKSHG